MLYVEMSSENPYPLMVINLPPPREESTAAGSFAVIEIYTLVNSVPAVLR